MTLPEIERRLREIWPNEPDALLVLRLLVTIDEALSTYITIPLVVQRLDVDRGLPAAAHAGDQSRIQAVYRWVDFLASEQVGLLDLHFEVLRDDGTTVDLDPQVVARALENGALYDPQSGQPVPDWKRRVVPYYVATEALRELRRALR